MSSLANESTPGGTAPRDAGENGSKADRPRRRPRVSARQVAHGAKMGSDAVRVRVASIVWIVAVVCAVILALAAILTALQKNVAEGNVIVEWLTGLANVVAGPFGEVNDKGAFHHGLFALSTNPKNVLANWGVAAICYLVIGRIASRVIHP